MPRQTRRHAAVGGRGGRSVKPLARSDISALPDRWSHIAHIVSGLLGSQRPTISVVAAKVSTSVRTLQRRFESDGLSFREILDACRWEEAVRHLNDTQLTIGQIAARLGYTDPAHFSRAFRRWQGLSPLEYRRIARIDGK